MHRQLVLVAIGISTLFALVPSDANAIIIRDKTEEVTVLWYYSNPYIPRLIGDLDSPIHLERNEAHVEMRGQFERWMDRYSHWGDQDAIVDAIERRLAPYRSNSREVQQRIDAIIRDLRERVERPRNPQSPGAGLGGPGVGNVGLGGGLLGDGFEWIKPWEPDWDEPDWNEL